MEKLFKLKENGTTVGREVIAGLTTFFAMAYIIAVNPTLLSNAGMEWGAVFLATIISAIIGTLIMGLVANVPYAQAPGMGLNAFFVYTVLLYIGLYLATGVVHGFYLRFDQHLNYGHKGAQVHHQKPSPAAFRTRSAAVIGIFVAYIGLLNVGIINFGSGVPALATLNQPAFWLFLIGLALTIVLLVCKVKGAILIGIVVTTPDRHPHESDRHGANHQFLRRLSATAHHFPGPFSPARDWGSLFSDASKIPLVLITIFLLQLVRHI